MRPVIALAEGLGDRVGWWKFDCTFVVYMEEKLEGRFSWEWCPVVVHARAAVIEGVPQARGRRNGGVSTPNCDVGQMLVKK